jgi:hypothetical protein
MTAGPIASRQLRGKYSRHHRRPVERDAAVFVDQSKSVGISDR